MTSASQLSSWFSSICVSATFSNHHLHDISNGAEFVYSQLLLVHRQYGLHDPDTLVHESDGDLCLVMAWLDYSAHAP